MHRQSRPLRSLRIVRRAGAVFALILPVGCASLSDPEPPASARPEIDVAIYRRAEVDRSARLEAEVRRLRLDLRQAEEALVLAESGLRGVHSRAAAVSRLAEARIQVERAAAQAPWRGEAIAEARAKLDEADSQIQGGRFGAALFFAYRSSRIAELLEREVEMVRGRPGTLYVRVGRVNLRAGPSAGEEIIGVLSQGTPVFPERTRDPWTLVRETSGSVGWVHRSLLRSK
jgi:hypothetical protein